MTAVPGPRHPVRVAADDLGYCGGTCFRWLSEGVEYVDVGGVAGAWCLRCARTAHLEPVP